MPAGRNPGGAFAAAGKLAGSAGAAASEVVIPSFEASLDSFDGELIPSGSDCIDETPNGSLFLSGVLSGTSAIASE